MNEAPRLSPQARYRFKFGPWPLFILGLGLLLSLGSCVSTPDANEPTSPSLDQTSVVRLLPVRVKKRDEWAAAVLKAIEELDKAPTAERVCAVIATIEQESGYQVDPQIPGLPRIVREGLAERLASLGPLREAGVAALLAGKAPGARQTFGERVDKLRSERDLDLLFRDLAAAYRERLPGTFIVASGLSLLLGKGSLYDLNPVTTAGSMQVKVSYARELRGLAPREDASVRDELYTLAGGVRYGTARLLDYPASYTDLIYRFADYNAGLYASRNAAFQERLSDLSGQKLILDGDLLAYDREGDALDTETESLKALLRWGTLHELSESRIRRDLEQEKEEDFESSATWQALNEAWESKRKRKISYARLPQLTLESPKLSKTRSTAWFAESVKRRYLSCRSRESSVR